MPRREQMIGEHLSAEPEDGASAPGDRIARAVMELRRSPQNRALQRYVYLVDGHELAPGQVDILEAALARPGLRMNELAKVLRLDASTVSRTILPLIRSGLVERRPDGRDGRLTRVHPTPSGVAHAATVGRGRQRVAAAVQDHFTAEELADFADLLERYVAAVTAVGDEAVGWPPASGSGDPEGPPVRT